jgi:glutaredoxin
MLHHTIITNRATQPTATCPDCHGATRTANRDGRLMRVCSDRSCQWGGEHMAAEEAEARAAMAQKGGVAA